MDMEVPIEKYKTIWISDIHLGTRGCSAEALLDFLKFTESDKLYLVGDIIDGWRLKKTWYWPQAHNDIVQKVLRKARKGTEVIYVCGNHDEVLRQFLGLQFGPIPIVDDDIHETADGKRLLVIHGDQFDGVVRYARWLAVLGDVAYDGMIWVNRWFNSIRRRLGFDYWSLSAYLKAKVKNAVSYISSFEEAVAQAAADRGVDGVVCGHIHKAELRQIGGILYANDGDWVESCTALVEHMDGRLEIIDWADRRQLNAWTMSPREPALAPT